MQTEKNLRAGMDPRQARRQAHVRLGGVDAIREAVRDARGARPLDDLFRDLGYALRSARRHHGPGRPDQAAARSCSQSTSFFVLQSQRDLATAQDAELRAILDYQRALIEFERTQRASLGGAGIALVGSPTAGGVSGPAGAAPSGPTLTPQR